VLAIVMYNSYYHLSASVVLEAIICNRSIRRWRPRLISALARSVLLLFPTAGKCDVRATLVASCDDVLREAASRRPPRRPRVRWGERDHRLLIGCRTPSRSRASRPRFSTGNRCRSSSPAAPFPVL